MQPYDGVDREAIWAALFALLKTRQSSDGYVTMSRHFSQAPKLALEQQPALFLVPTREARDSRPGGLPVKLTLMGFIVLYFQAPPPSLEDTGGETQLGATVINGLLKGLDDALVPDDVTCGRQTLGGLVQHCWIEGDVDIDPGMYSQQGAAVVPIKILVP